MWTADEFNEWCKKQTKELKTTGLSASTAGITRLLYSRVIVPNNITLRELIKSDINIKRRRR